jgi:serine/threonine-protein kinase
LINLEEAEAYMQEYKFLCMGCMCNSAEETICPNCGYNKNQRQKEYCLKKGTILQGRYIVGKQLQQNGEGISYIGYDIVEKFPVRIREFFPATLCSRVEDSEKLFVTPNFKERFCQLMNKFLNTSRSLAIFKNLNAVFPIYDIFETNNTAYAVAEWEEYTTLTEFVLKRGGVVNWKVLRALFMPVISTLSTIHSSGITHLGLSPDTLVIARSGKMKILDFCIEEVRKSNSDLEPELYRGCAALEQYVDGYGVSMSTDVYGFTASLFFALTGRFPKEAIKRQTDDKLLVPVNILKKIPSYVIVAIADGLKVFPENRTKSFNDLRVKLSAIPELARQSESEDDVLINKKRGSVSKFGTAFISFLITISIFLMLAVIINSFYPFETWINSKNMLSSTNYAHVVESIYFQHAVNTLPINNGKIYIL